LKAIIGSWEWLVGGRHVMVWRLPSGGGVLAI